ncbi:hypothetical protein [Streptomyces sp. NPDC096013]|uniref:hypothetical protein n=1 Tax=Streptomyces sp. NPDC096013 TaxID=3366069 RepID=UPI0037F5052C
MTGRIAIELLRRPAQVAAIVTIALAPWRGQLRPLRRRRPAPSRRQSTASVS